MGRTINEWVAKVANLLSDAEAKDQRRAQIEAVGLEPAFAQFSVDRPRVVVAEVVGGGLAYFGLPAGWTPGFSALLAVEHPARMDPPSVLDSQSWRMVRSTADVAVEQILLDRSPSASQYVRFTFTASWPYPTDNATVDVVDGVGFEAVCALAASFCLVSLASMASKARMASIPTNYMDGAERARSLLEAASRYEAVYKRYLGIRTGDGDGDEGIVGASGGPAWGSFDLDPSHGSLFHGGRR